MPSREQEPEGPDQRREALLARRAQQRRQVRRRRLVASGALMAAVVIAAAAFALAGGGSGSGGSGSTTASAKDTKATAGSGSRKQGSGGAERPGPVRNATPQPGWEPHTGPVPILEYHVLGEPPPEAPYPELFVAKADFAQQLDWLDSHGYQAVTLEQVQEAWYHGATLPPKPVVLSFDDGYEPDYTVALPQLRRHGWAGLLNLKAGEPELYESQVQKMIAAGWELAAHTINHLDLTELDAAALREEVAGSRQILQRKYKVPVKNFCYPSGAFDETVIAAVEAAGYVGATTEIPGFAESGSPYELARFEVLRSNGVPGLAEDLGSG